MAQARKTVLFHPINAPGHIGPSLAIADRLKRDYGYQTVFMVLGETLNSIRDHGHKLIVLEDVAGQEPKGGDRRGGAQFKTLHAKDVAEVMLKRREAIERGGIEAWMAICELLKSDWLPKEMRNAANMAATIESVKPALVVMDHVRPKLHLMEKESVRPWVRIHSPNPMDLLEPAETGAVIPPPVLGLQLFTKRERARLREEEPDRWRAILVEWDRLNKMSAKAIDEALADLTSLYKQSGFGDRLKSGRMSVESPFLNIYMYPEALDYSHDDDLFKYPPRWLPCDSLVRKPLGELDSSEIELWTRKVDEAMARGKEKMIYFSLGSIASGNAELMRHYVDILGSDKERLYVVSKGAEGDRYELEAENMLGANYVPQPYLLQRADLAIIHGGNNSTTECMYYGKPMIVLPCFYDQFDNAQRVEDLGFGRRLDVYRCSGGELLQAIGELLSDSELISRTETIGRRMRARDEVGKVAAILDRLIEDGGLAESTIGKFARGEEMADQPAGRAISSGDGDGDGDNNKWPVSRFKFSSHLEPAPVMQWAGRGLVGLAAAHNGRRLALATAAATAHAPRARRGLLFVAATAATATTSFGRADHSQIGQRLFSFSD